MELDDFRGLFPSFESPDGPPTFQNEDNLPSLPVPELRHTLDLYLDSVRPLVSNEVFANTRMIVDKFAASPESRQLQAKLVERGRDNKNWLHEWWLKYAYLTNRDSLHPVQNIGGPAPHHRQFWTAQENSQLPRAALTLHLYAKVWKLLRTETFQIDKNSAGKFMSMNQFRFFFSTCRVPGEHCDTVLNYFNSVKEGPAPTHMVVLMRERYFAMEFVDQNEEPFSPIEYLRQLEFIQKCCLKDPILKPHVNINPLTVLPRAAWTQKRQHLISLDRRNLKNLELIQKAAFVLSFLEDSPTNNKEILDLALKGDVRNLFADKSATMFITKNGLFLNNCDHAPMDAMAIIVTTYMIDIHVYQHSGNCGLNGNVRPNLDPPQEFYFITDSEIESAIATSYSENLVRRQSLDLTTFDFTNFGKDKLKEVKVNPDTFVQMSLQLAYYREHGKPAPTYETASTRQFYKGRTETLRSCTAESVNMCRVLVASGSSKKQQAVALKAAIDKHNKARSLCEQAKGCDRHLMGLSILAAEAGLPPLDIFTDPSFTLSGGNGNFILSTSCVGYTTAYGCVAPMCKNGYGVFYRIGPKKISISMSRWTADKETSIARLSRTMQLSMEQLYKVLQDDAQTEVRPSL